MNDLDFNIDACNTCSMIIMDNFKNNGKNKNNIIEKFKRTHNLKESNKDIFKLIKNIYCNKLDNDKYGINNLKEVN